jgi:isopenicillin N synthase-like dioxygenase
LFSPNTDKTKYQQCLEQIKQACTEWGFFQIINHSIDKDLIVRTVKEMKEYFHSPLQVKLLNKRNANNSRGYANDELTKQKHDWKEIFDYGSPIENEQTTLDGRNQWPSKDIFPNFQSTMMEYYEANAKLAEVLLDALAKSLQIDENFFRMRFSNHTSFTRLNYYPELPKESKSMETLGISRHTDAGGLTVLWQDGPGLQVYSGTKQDRNDGKWVDVKPYSDLAFTVNIGDMFHVWTGGICAAPEHRVIANHEKERYSIPFFYNPNYDAVVQHIDGLAGTKQKYRPFTWGQFRQARFAGDYADLGKESQIEDWEIL